MNKGAVPPPKDPQGLLQGKEQLGVGARPLGGWHRCHVVGAGRKGEMSPEKHRGVNAMTRLGHPIPGGCSYTHTSAWGLCVPGKASAWLTQCLVVVLTHKPLCGPLWSWEDKGLGHPVPGGSSYPQISVWAFVALGREGLGSSSV